MDGTDAAVIAHVIQLSVAPVFLLSGVAALLTVMTGRLSRVLDRARGLEDRWKALDEAGGRGGVCDLVGVKRRAPPPGLGLKARAPAGPLVLPVIARLFLPAVPRT